MKPIMTIGFPRMRHEAGEKRVFLPEFIEYVVTLGAQVYIEEGYGSRSGYTFEDYKQANPAVNQCSREEAFQQDVVLILRSPKPEEFKLIKRGSILVTMLHYPTRPKRVKTLQELGIRAISLDSIVNDKTPIHVVILGTGMVGKHAVDAATKLGNIERNSDHIADSGPGAIALSVGRNISSNPVMMEKLMSQADILVDATQRRNPSKPVVPNAWLAWLPEHAIVVDLAVDPYILDANPPVVRGVEGIPQGNLDQYVFDPDDPKWDQLVPESIPSKHRRTTVTCYSWPGVHAEACMRHYAQQVEPLMDVLFEKGYNGLSLNGSYFERALYRATLKAWLSGEAEDSPQPAKRRQRSSA